MIAPFAAQARLDLEALDATAKVATRMLDNVYSASTFPLPQQAEAARASRRLGLGLTGLADALIMLGLRYDSPGGLAAAVDAMRTINEAAYNASIELARERGSFERFDAERYLASPFVARLPATVRKAIARDGIRNSHLTAIAPAGTISLVAGNVSSGLEPVFALEYARNVRQRDGSIVRADVESYALTLWRRLKGEAPLPDTFVTASTVSADAQIAMQAALQPHVDNAISKTTNVPADIPFDEFERTIGALGSWASKGARCFARTP